MLPSLQPLHDLHLIDLANPDFHALLVCMPICAHNHHRCAAILPDQEGDCRDDQGVRNGLRHHGHLRIGPGFQLPLRIFYLHPHFYRRAVRVERRADHGYFAIELLIGTGSRNRGCVPHFQQRRFLLRNVGASGHLGDVHDGEQGSACGGHLSVSAVETLIFRARRTLREQLEGAMSCDEFVPLLATQKGLLAVIEGRRAVRHARHVGDTGVIGPGDVQLRHVLTRDLCQRREVGLILVAWPLVGWRLLRP